MKSSGLEFRGTTMESNGEKKKSQIRQPRSQQAKCGQMWDVTNAEFTPASHGCEWFSIFTLSLC